MKNLPYFHSYALCIAAIILELIIPQGYLNENIGVCVRLPIFGESLSGQRYSTNGTFPGYTQDTGCNDFTAFWVKTERKDTDGKMDL
jgi:hypothetical protein